MIILRILQSAARGAMYLGFFVAGISLVTLQLPAVAGGLMLAALGWGAGRLLSAIGPVHERARTGLSALAEEGDLEGVQRALDAGEDPNKPDRDGSLPLSTAALHGQTAVAQLLVARGARDLDAALSWACHSSKGTLELISFLLEHGASPNAKDPKIGEALYGAVTSEKGDAARLLLERGARWDVDHVVRADSTLLREFRARGAPAQQVLGAAVARGDVALAREMLQQGADADALLAGHITTNCHGACDDAIRLLITLGANPNSEVVQREARNAIEGMPWREEYVNKHLAIARGAA